MHIEAVEAGLGACEYRFNSFFELLRVDRDAGTAVNDEDQVSMNRRAKSFCPSLISSIHLDEYMPWTVFGVRQVLDGSDLCRKVYHEQQSAIFRSHGGSQCSQTLKGVWCGR